jgi:amino acid transporter
MFQEVMGTRGGGFGMWFISECSLVSLTLRLRADAGLASIVFIIAVFCAISICSAASRATWAFARDKAIPFHGFFARISWGLPVNAYILSTMVQVLLGLIYLGSSTAFNAFVGVAVMCLQASYAMPVAISLFHKRTEFTSSRVSFGSSDPKAGEDGRFSLGRWGWVINAIAVSWTAFEIVLFSMPPVVPVTKTTMSK